MYLITSFRRLSISNYLFHNIVKINMCIQLHNVCTHEGDTVGNANIFSTLSIFPMKTRLLYTCQNQPMLNPGDQYRVCRLAGPSPYTTTPLDVTTPCIHYTEWSAPYMGSSQCTFISIPMIHHSVSSYLDQCHRYTDRT